MTSPRVVAVRALVPDASSSDRDEGRDWILDSKIASPMSIWPEYRATRRSWALEALGSFVVEIEASDGTIGVAPSLGGAPAAYLVERHLARFVEGRTLARESIDEAWQQLFRASLHYGRRGLALNAISALDLASWDLLGKATGQPVWSLLGPKVHDQLPAYATTTQPEVARMLGFVGGKFPLPAGPAEGDAGFEENVTLARKHAAAGSDGAFFLACDCYMALDVDYACRLADALAELGYAWIEECLPPDDYWGYRALREHAQGRIKVATGEHESTRWGFQLLLEWECADIVQPDVAWCGGLSELLRIAELASARGVAVVPHGSSVYSYHFSVTSHDTPFVEFPLLGSGGTVAVPPYSPLLTGEPLPVDGEITVGDEPGFGVELNRDLRFHRPYQH